MPSHGVNVVGSPPASNSVPIADWEGFSVEGVVPKSRRYGGVLLYPFVLGDATETSPTIAIDASIAFGRPVIRRRGISTSVIADRIDAGESVADIALDYEINEAEVSAAVLLERAA